MAKLEIEEFDFDINVEDLIINTKKIELYDDGTPSTGDVYDIEFDFNDKMRKAEEEMFEILRESK